MSYSITINGHVDSVKGEAEALKGAIELSERLKAEGVFAFAGSHFHILQSTPEVGRARARELIDGYNATADADDKV